MTRRAIPFSFPNGRGQTLAGLLDLPEGQPLFYGVFGPCFTCTRDSHAAFKVCRMMADRGAAMLRLDTTGVGASGGKAEDTNFTTRVGDLVAAAAALEKDHAAPRLLVGHSLSGTAALAAAQRIPSLRALATIGSPADPARTIDKFRRGGLIADKGDRVEIDVLGRPFLFKKSFVDDMLAQHVAEDTAALTVPLYIFHAPRDEIVAFDEARVLAERAGKNAKLVTLDDGATHLFNNRNDDAELVAETLVKALTGSSASRA